MKTLKTHIHSDIKDLSKKTTCKRLAARAIVLIESDILLLHTKRYDDYSLPGGGLNRGEDPEEGMVRELQEETGALNIRDIKPFGIYEEYRPWGRDGYDVQHMISYCYTCSVDKNLGATQYESYEVKNGMTPLWVNIEDAILHNEKIIEKSPKKGLSVERETFLLRLIRENLLTS